jgi:hypothetical protein
MNYLNNNKTAKMKAKRPIASAKPAPINALFVNSGSTEGFLDIALISAANMLPTPIAAPNMPIALSPIPIYFSASISINVT